MPSSRVVFFIVLVAAGHLGCINKYPNWRYVRIEFSVPSEDCKYRIQEVCHSEGGDCFNWYKKRATLYDANTVVVTARETSRETKGGLSGVSSYEVTKALADYYSCPEKRPLHD